MVGTVLGPATTSRRSRPGRFRRWRRTRPFWGAFLVIVGGAEILASVRAPLPVILHIGLQGMAGYLVPLLLVTCGALLLVTPAQRAFYAIVSIILALASWLTSNLGGFLIGMLLALVGGCLALAWTPRPHRPAGAALPTGTADTAALPTVTTDTAVLPTAMTDTAVLPTATTDTAVRHGESDAERAR